MQCSGRIDLATPQRTVHIPVNGVGGSHKQVLLYVCPACGQGTQLRGGVRPVPKGSITCGKPVQGDDPGTDQ